MIIDVTKLNSLIESIKQDIKDYEINIYAAVSTTKNMYFYWHDKYTKSFFKKIDKELEDTNALIKCLYKVLRLMQSLQTYYKNFNRLQEKLIGVCSDIINLDNFVVGEEDSPEIAVKKRQLFSEICSIEDEVANLVALIKTPMIECISFDNLSTSTDTSDFAGMKANMSTEIEKLELQCKSIDTYQDKLIDTLNTISTIYSSKNLNNIEKIITELSSDIYEVRQNLKNAYDYIINTRNSYKVAFELLAEEARNINI